MDPPDAQEKRIRFGCGFVLGLVAGGYIALRAYSWGGYVAVAIILICALLCGLLAMKQGDRFWLALASLRWWR